MPVNMSTDIIPCLLKVLVLPTLQHAIKTVLQSHVIIWAIAHLTEAHIASWERTLIGQPFCL